MNRSPLFLVIDLFCGAGGTSEGFEQATVSVRQVAKVVACVNHDQYAIKSHALNFPDAKHFTEDIRTLDLSELLATLNYWKSVYPDALVILWASLECTNFSRAKGGLPRNVDSRTLAENLYMRYNPVLNEYERKNSYIQVLKPDYIMIENVVEFMAWGPCDEKGKPLSQKSGTDWLRWRQDICSYGYRDRWEEMNAANFGAHTSRNRLFGLFAGPDLPMCFPNATHAKEPQIGLFGNLQKWRPVKEVLNLADQGQSIFNRAKPLSENTLKRIYAGLNKHITGGESGFLSLYYSGGGTHASVYTPCPVIPTKDRIALVTAEFIGQLSEPANKQYILFNPAWGSNSSSVEQPSCVVVARQDKAPLYLVETEGGRVIIPVYNTDSPMTRKIKEFMGAHSIINIRMRMLRIPELLQIQGFRPGYFLAGTQTRQKKFIGNAVVPAIVKAWIETLASSLPPHKVSIAA